MKEWHRIEAHRQRLTRVGDLFAANPDRARRFSLREGGLLFDYSKTLLDDGALAALRTLAIEAGTARQRDDMLAGRRINSTENRAVLHTALRRPRGDALLPSSDDGVMAEVHAVLHRMQRFSDSVRSGEKKGEGGRITDIINIGIGGSDLGPEMTCQALSPYGDGPVPHFISNADSAQAADCLAHLNPATTLVIIASKTFTTIETMTNAASVRDWILQGAGADSLRRQFAAVSSDTKRCVEFGLDHERVFGFGDYVGGRYSIWGPVGLPLMLWIGSDGFRSFLDGGHSMDAHFAAAPPESNLPLTHGLVGVWHHQVCRYPARAILPYAHRLRRLPAYLQQLIMESNGKSVTRGGAELDRPSAAVIWGEPGTNGQHAFFQALHQGTQAVPCEFLIAACSHEPDLPQHQDILIASCLAQSEALMTGRTSGERGACSGDARAAGAAGISAHRRCPGNRPSTTLVFPKLTPFALGQLIAMYEHSVFVEGAVLGINSFDQWGVELGKDLAGTLLSAVQTGAAPHTANGSTAMLLEFIRQVRGAEGHNCRNALTSAAIQEAGNP